MISFTQLIHFRKTIEKKKHDLIKDVKKILKFSKHYGTSSSNIENSFHSKGETINEVQFKKKIIVGEMI